MWKRCRPRIFMLAICSAFPARLRPSLPTRRPALAPTQPYLAAIGRPAALPSLRRVTVAVVEAGVDGNHPDLAGRIVGARRFGGGDPLFPASPHGTAVAGLIAAIDGNGQGIDGIAPNARLLVAGTSFDPLSIAQRDQVGGRPSCARDQPLPRRSRSGAGLRGGGRLRTGPWRARRRGGRELLRRELRALHAARRRASALRGCRTCLPSARRPPTDRRRASRSRARAGSISRRPASSSRRSGRPGTTHIPRRPTARLSAPPAATRQAGPSDAAWGPSGTSFATAMVSAAAAILFGADPTPPRAGRVLAPGNGSTGRRSATPGGGRSHRRRGGPRARAPRSIPQADYAEPNDRASAAARIRPPGIRATLDWRDDPVDVYRLTLRRGDTVVVQSQRAGCDGLDQRARLRLFGTSRARAPLPRTRPGRTCCGSLRPSARGSGSRVTVHRA